MNIGMLWFDNNAQSDLDTRITPVLGKIAR